MRKKILLITILLLICTKLVFAQDSLQRYYLSPPYKGQMSGYSDWTIPEQAWNELTNCYVDEQGKIVMRPGFYCWLAQDLATPVDGATLYKAWINGGYEDYIVYQSLGRIRKNTTTYGSTPSTISVWGITDDAAESIYYDEGAWNWDTYHNNLYGANGYDNAIQWNINNERIAQIGRVFGEYSVEFQDSNVIEIVEIGAKPDVSGYEYTYGTDEYWMHFRVGMDLVVSGSDHNDGTYEIIEADANLLTVSTTTGGGVAWNTEEVDVAYLYGYGFPDDISSTRTITVSYISTDDVVFDTNTVCITGVQWWLRGWAEGMTLTISGSTSNDGTYEIEDPIAGDTYCMEIDPNYTFTAGTDSSTITFTGTKSVTNALDAFNPTCIAGHKGRLFAGGVSEYPTKLYWSQSIFRDQYYWDLWRDSYGEDEGTGYYDMKDKVIALVGEWRNRLIVFCENSILYLDGDDPGFDILTPSQSLVFHPVPVSNNIGCVGPEAWCEANGDIYFYSKAGLRKLSIVESGGESQFTILSLPINDLHDDIMEAGLEKRINMKFLKALNLILINAATTYYNNIILVYNISNNSFAKWTFTSGKEPNCLFNALGPDIDSDAGVPYDTAKPYETVWYGSQDGRFWALQEAYAHDAITNTKYSITMQAITSKLNMGQPFLEKNFQRTVFFCSPQINYDDGSQGQVSFYNKIDDGSWSSAFTKSFTQHSEADGTAIDYYEYLDPGVGFRGTGKTIQYKIVTSGTTGRFGLEFVGAMCKWEDIDSRI